ncbi:InlB B-repeat-containing protein [Shivajiella indica]|uniref:Bacterial repeat domain-containing protein n=1 Tax=Shivajiella indica TaxID=872115 RepID=A0ABW5BCM8_9BACT
MRKKNLVLIFFMLILLQLTSCVEFGFLDEGKYSQNIEIHEIEVGSKVELVAEPNPGFVFSHWARNGEIVSNKETYVFTMPDKEINLTANFTRE